MVTRAGNVIVETLPGQRLVGIVPLALGIHRQLANILKFFLPVQRINVIKTWSMLKKAHGSYPRNLYRIVSWNEVIACVTI